MFRALFSLLLFSILSGCMTPDYFTVIDSSNLERREHRIIISDFCKALTVSVPPKDFILYFPNDEIGFASDLLHVLRKRGYKVQKSKSYRNNELQLGYQIIELDDNNIRMRLVAGRIFNATRVYERTSKGTIEPIGPMLIRN